MSVTTCGSFTPQRAWKETQRVLLVLLLTDDKYQRQAVKNFHSVDRHLLSETVHALWHMPFRTVLPDGVIHRNFLGKYELFETQKNNTFLTLGEPLLLPHTTESFERAQATHPAAYCHPKHNLSYSIANRYYTHQML